MPRKSPKSTRPRIVHFRATDAETTILEGKAAAAGMSLSAYARAVLLESEAAAAGDPTRPALPDPQLMMLSDQIKRVGVNLNQIAHKLNQGFAVTEGDRLGDVLEEVRRVVRKAQAQVFAP